MSFSPETYAMLIGKGGGGGGSGLPTPTEEDVGKTMMVQANYTKGACIVPEQTVTTVYDSEAECCIAPLSNVDSSVVPPEFSPAIMVIDGVETVAEITNIGPNWNCPNGELPCFNNWGGGEFDTEEAGTHTVALYLAVVSYTWVPAYPRIVATLTDLNTGYTDKTWNEIREAMYAGIPCFFKIRDPRLGGYGYLYPFFKVYSFTEGSTTTYAADLLTPNGAEQTVADSADGYLAYPI